MTTKTVKNVKINGIVRPEVHFTQHTEHSYEVKSRGERPIVITFKPGVIKGKSWFASGSAWGHTPSHAFEESARLIWNNKIKEWGINIKR